MAPASCFQALEVDGISALQFSEKIPDAIERPLPAFGKNAKRRYKLASSNVNARPLKFDHSIHPGGFNIEMKPGFPLRKSSALLVERIILEPAPEPDIAAFLVAFIPFAHCHPCL